jgi:hypothetical protein
MREGNQMSGEGWMLKVTRSFGWGFLAISDASHSGDIPELGPGGRVGISPQALGIAVRHALDNDIHVLDDEGYGVLATVTVLCSAGLASDVALEIDTVMQIPSGRLQVGDPDENAVVELSPGAWRIQVALNPPDHAEEVRVWLSGA